MLITKRELLVALYKAKLELKSEAYKTKFSIFWWVLDPLLLMGIYYILFGVILDRYGPNFLIQLFLGLVLFNWFKLSFIPSSNSIVSASNIVTHLNFNKIILPTAKFIVGTVKTLVILFPLMLFIIIKNGPNLNYFVIPFLFIAQGCLIFSLSNFAALLATYYPDFRNFSVHLVRVLLYMSGVLYPVSVVPEIYKNIFLMNPFAFFINGFREVAFYNNLPSLTYLVAILILSIMLMNVSINILNRHNSKLARVLIEK